MNLNRKTLIENIKSFVQIVIPVLALIVAILSFTDKFHSLKKQAEKDKQEVKQLLLRQENRIKAMEYRIELYSENQKTEKNK